MILLDWANSDGTRVGDWTTDAPRQKVFVSAWMRNARHPSVMMEVMLPTILHLNLKVVVLWKGRDLRPGWDVGTHVDAETVAAQASEMVAQAISRESEGEAS